MEAWLEIEIFDYPVLILAAKADAAGDRALDKDHAHRVQVEAVAEILPRAIRVETADALERGAHYTQAQIEQRLEIRHRGSAERPLGRHGAQRKTLSESAAKVSSSGRTLPSAGTAPSSTVRCRAL